jgi:signal transduction histidine kinase
MAKNTEQKKKTGQNAPKSVKRKKVAGKVSDASAQDQTKNLREMNALLMSEVAMRKRLEKDLIERTKKLEEADRRKNEFLAVLSHELRNPLAPIVASVETAKLRCVEDPETKLAFDIIERQTENMARMLKDLLDVSRILYGKIELLPENVDIREVIWHAVNTTEFFAVKRNHALTQSLPDEPVRILVDPLRVEQIVENLIFNAVKYTEPGGKIEVSLRCEDDGVSIKVKDNGVGIDPAALPKVFDLFSQIDGILKKTKGGMGIGLFIGKQLAMLHGGTLAAYSKGIGSGSEFTLRLPFKNHLSSRVSTEASGAVANNKDAEPKRILVVDDNHDAADSLGKLLSHLGHAVQVAYNGKEAILMAKEMPPDIAFVDIAMPEMNGYEVAKEIRDDYSLSKTKLVALTGFGQKSDKEDALRSGFDFHYVKPITLATLREVLEA